LVFDDRRFRRLQVSPGCERSILWFGCGNRDPAQPYRGNHASPVWPRFRPQVLSDFLALTGFLFDNVAGGRFFGSIVLF
jgi:hypothetical protein